MLKIDSSKRIFGLDIPRCFAIITVLYNHGYIYAKNVIPQKAYDYFHFDGVSLFFVLSGFLIGIILIKSLESSGASYASLKTFWIRRWYRTLPLYFLVLILLAVYKSIINGPGFILGVKSYFFFLQNFYSFKNTFFITSWSLSVEEWFYLIVPVLLWGMVRMFKMNTKRALQLVITCFIIFCPVLRYFRLQELLANGTYTQDRLSFTVLCRLDAIMFGLMASYFYWFHRVFWEKHKIALLFTGLIIVIADYFLSIVSAPYGLKGNEEYKTVFHYTILPFAILCIMPFFNSINSGKGVIAYTVTLFSVVSYSLYLIHNSIVMPIIIPIIKKRLLHVFNEPVSYSIIYVAYWSISLFLAVLIYKYYEHPMTNLRDKLKNTAKRVKNKESKAVLPAA